MFGHLEINTRFCSPKSIKSQNDCDQIRSKNSSHQNPTRSKNLNVPNGKLKRLHGVRWIYISY